MRGNTKPLQEGVSSLLVVVTRVSGHRDNLTLGCQEVGPGREGLCDTGRPTTGDTPVRASSSKPLLFLFVFLKSGADLNVAIKDINDRT